jgi:hypothetical protein
MVGYQPEVKLDHLLEITIRETCEQLRMPVPASLATA